MARSPCYRLMLRGGQPGPKRHRWRFNRLDLMEYDPRYLTAIDEFNQGLFYEAHETLEQLWLEGPWSRARVLSGDYPSGGRLLQVGAGGAAGRCQAVPLGHTGSSNPTGLSVSASSVTEFLSDVEADLAVIRSVARQGAAPPPSCACRVCRGRASPRLTPEPPASRGREHHHMSIPPQVNRALRPRFPTPACW